VLLLAFVIGVTAGLRSMTPLAVVAWTMHGRWPGLHWSLLAFMAARATMYIFVALACLELVADKLPFIPSRLAPGPLSVRVFSGGLAAATLAVAAQESLLAAAAAGALGAIAGALGGYYARKNLVAGLKLPDVVIALSEDAIAIGVAIAVAHAS